MLPKITGLFNYSNNKKGQILCVLVLGGIKTSEIVEVPFLVLRSSEDRDFCCESHSFWTTIMSAPFWHLEYALRSSLHILFAQQLFCKFRKRRRYVNSLYSSSDIIAMSIFNSCIPYADYSYTCSGTRKHDPT